MIKLELKPYCENCPDFEPDVDKKEETLTCQNYVGFMADTTVIHKCDTTIRCKNRNKCRCIMEHLTQENKKGEK